jgi:hypothetical protein
MSTVLQKFAEQCIQYNHGFISIIEQFGRSMNIHNAILLINTIPHYSKIVLNQINLLNYRTRRITVCMLFDYFPFIFSHNVL